MTTAVVCIALAAGAVRALESADGRAALVPADLGATCIDASGYPAEHRRTYAEVFPKCGVCHTPARAINAPLLELRTDELAAFRRAHADVVKDARVLAARSAAWREYVSRMWKRPPCCALCPTFTRDEAAAVWRFLVYDSKRRKAGPALSGWVAYRKGLIETFTRLKAEEDREDEDERRVRR